jgi:hypothetical protein
VGGWLGAGNIPQYHIFYRIKFHTDWPHLTPIREGFWLGGSWALNKNGFVNAFGWEDCEADFCSTPGALIRLLDFCHCIVIHGHMVVWPVMVMRCP